MSIVIRMADVVYDASTNKVCDIYFKESTEEEEQKKPIVFLVHGGAWMFGKKEGLADLAHLLVKKLNIVCIVPEYSLSTIDPVLLSNAAIWLDWILMFGLLCVLYHHKLMLLCLLFLSILITISLIVRVVRQVQQRQQGQPGGKNSHPVHVMDLANCITWAVNPKNNDNSGGSTLFSGWDVTRLFLIGHSAGAHLAALVVLNQRFLSDCIRKHIRGIICISGVYSFWQFQRSFVQHILNRGVFAIDHTSNLTQSNLSFLKETRTCACKLCQVQTQRWAQMIDAWPIFHVATKTEYKKPAMLLMTAELDLGLLQHTVDLERELKTNDFHVQHLHFRDVNHFSILRHWDTKNKQIGDTVLDFLRILMS